MTAWKAVVSVGYDALQSLTEELWMQIKMHEATLFEYVNKRDMPREHSSDYVVPTYYAI